MGSGISECWRGIRPSNPVKREDFEEIVLFLLSVPFFKNQLSQCKLPQLAQELQGSRKTWLSGDILVKQDQDSAWRCCLATSLSNRFVLILSGEVDVVKEEYGEETFRATLRAGDHFGGHNLISQRPSTVSLKARSYKVVTLSLDRTQFDRLGLKDVLQFRRRPAFQRGQITEDIEEEVGEAPTSEDLEFIMKSICRNSNLRGISNDRQLVENVAKHAKTREVRKDETVARAGEVGKDFFIIKSGSFFVKMNTARETEAPGGAEQIAVTSTTADKLAKRQRFLFSTLSMASRRMNTSVLEASKSMPPARRNSFQFSSNAQSEKIKVGQEVTYADEEAVGVVRTIRSGVAKVDFRGRRRDLDISLLRIAKDRDVIATLLEKDSFGEVSLIYHTRRLATYVAREDSVVYVISAKRLRPLMERRKGDAYKQNCTLLDEVELLKNLVCAERYELATYANKVSYAPGEVILRQGVKRKACLWYVVKSGSGLVDVKDGESEKRLGEIHHAGFFGEHSLLAEDKVPHETVTAGPSGLTCLTFDGDIAIKILKAVLVESHNAPLHPVSSHGFCRCEAQRKDLTEVCVIGSGSFSTVYLMETKADPTQKYALKKMSKGHIKSSGMIEYVCWEKDLMTMINSEFVINLHKTFNDDTNIELLMDVCLGGDLCSVISAGAFKLGAYGDTRKGFPVAFFVGCITLGLEHLHERRIAHRDLKPANVLLDERGYAKICDMGFARFILDKTYTLAGTPEYMAPEMIDRPHAHNQTVDWWSLGCLAFELYVGDCPFDTFFYEGSSLDECERLDHVRSIQERNDLMFPYGIPGLMKNFITRLLAAESSRLGKGGAHEVKGHRWFSEAGVDFDLLKKKHIFPPFEPPPFNPGEHPKEDDHQALDYQPDQNNRWSLLFSE